MGQRLNIEIRKDDKVLANAYYHWSGYTSSSLRLTEHILNNIEKINYENDIVKAIKLLETTGAGLTKDELDNLNEDLKSLNFELANSRDDGLIAISEKGINETQDWEEARVEVHLDTQTLKLNLYFEIKEDEIDEEYKIAKASMNYSEVSFSDFNKVKEEILEHINNKNYYFEYDNKKYGFIE